MTYINLTEKLFLGKGRERACYKNPEDDSKVIKIVYRKNQNLNQNEMEYEYLKYLEKKGKSFSHLARCYGKINTNMGIGYLFEHIKDYNGNTSKSFKYMVMNGILSPKLEIELLEKLKNFIDENKIIFVDIALSNIFCQEISEDNFKLVITDGIGGKRVGLKSKLYMYSSFFTNYKVKKQWKKLFKRYEKVIKQGIEAKTRQINE